MALLFTQVKPAASCTFLQLVNTQRTLQLVAHECLHIVQPRADLTACDWVIAQFRRVVVHPMQTVHLFQHLDDAPRTGKHTYDDITALLELFALRPMRKGVGFGRGADRHR